MTSQKAANKKNEKVDKEPEMIKQRMTKVKNTAKQDLAVSSSSIVTDAKQGLSVVELESFPLDSNIKRRVTNARRPFGGTDVDMPLPLMILSEPFKTTNSGERFLLFDSRISEPNQPVIMIYASEHGLLLLRQNKRWSIDGTFFSCPQNFAQLYSINVFKGISSLPAVFFLLPGKSQEVYKRAFDALFNGRPQLVPDAVMSDFELAPVNVLKERFPLAVFSFCLFHFGQSLFKKFQQQGLVELYSIGDNKALLRSFNALGFLPVGEVGLGFDELVEQVEEKIELGVIPELKVGPLRDYLKYIAQTYIRRNDINGLPVEPLFPIGSWNYHLHVLNDLPRTNNAIEGFHFGWNKRFAKNNMPLSQFLIRLKDEEEATAQLDIRHEANPADPVRNARKKKVEMADCQIKQLVVRYTEVNVFERNRVSFLRRMQQHLSKSGRI